MHSPGSCILFAFPVHSLKAQVQTIEISIGIMKPHFYVDFNSVNSDHPFFTSFPCLETSPTNRAKKACKTNRWTDFNWFLSIFQPDSLCIVLGFGVAFRHFFIHRQQQNSGFYPPPPRCVGMARQRAWKRDGERERGKFVPRYQWSKSNARNRNSI